MSLPNGRREDHVNVVLDKDDTGYINITKVVDNSGCYAQCWFSKGNDKNTRIQSVRQFEKTGAMFASRCLVE